MTRPTLVNTAVMLIWGGIAASGAGVALLTFQLARSSSDTPTELALWTLIGGALLAVIISITLQIRDGKNWARWVYVGVTAYSLLSIGGIRRELESSVAMGTLHAISTLLFIGAAALLLTRTAHDWFKHGGNGVGRVA